MNGRNTSVLSIRVPDGLYTCVRELAKKRRVTVNDWLKGVVTTAAKYPVNNDPSASQEKVK